MKKIFRAWLIGIFIFAIIASCIVGIESAVFGLFLLPFLIVVIFLILLGRLK